VALADGDLFWHSESNLKGSWLGMSLLYRRLSYFVNRCSSFLTVQPYYQVKEPRRHNTAVTHAGQTAWR